MEEGRRVVPSDCGEGVAVLVDECLGVLVAVLDELACCVEAVVYPGVFDFALHGGDEEADDESAVAGLLADDVCEGGLGVAACSVVVRCSEHQFYCRACVKGVATTQIHRLIWTSGVTDCFQAGNPDAGETPALPVDSRETWE